MSELELGPSPADEPCAQVGSDDYYERMNFETRRYIRLLERLNPNPPDGCRFRRKSNEHDFGTYHEVVLCYNRAIQSNVDYAFKVESTLPARWPKCDHSSIHITASSVQVQQGTCAECGKELS